MLDVLKPKNLPFFPVCSYGRSGTSLLMNVLRCMDVAVVPPLPFEDRTAQVCFVHRLRAEAGGIVPAEQGSAGADVQAFGAAYHSALATASKDPAECRQHFSEYVESCSKDRKRGIAEKLVGFNLIRVLKALDDSNLVRPIFLIRDPRDIFLSVKDFNTKRGFRSFNDLGDDVRLLRIICHFEEMQIGLCSQMRGFLCYYEDLIARRERTLVELAAYIGPTGIDFEGIESVWRKLDAGVDEARAHMTSDAARMSVGKWSSPVAIGYKSLFASEAARLSRIGYAP
ncbi:MAG: hypothetical protein J0I21_12545 [Alphaproteobacteria bacterium]|nr:hypothetical protein [Alphaproteobacteria bacterium]